MEHPEQLQTLGNIQDRSAFHIAQSAWRHSGMANIMSDDQKIKAAKKALDYCATLLAAKVLANELFPNPKQAAVVINWWREKRGYTFDE